MQSEFRPPLILVKMWTQCQGAQFLGALFMLISPKALLFNIGGRASTYGLEGGKDSVPVSVVYDFHTVTERFGDPGLMVNCISRTPLSTRLNYVILCLQNVL